MLFPSFSLTDLVLRLLPALSKPPAPPPSALPPSLRADLDRARADWDVAGISLALVLSPAYAGAAHPNPGGWHSEVLVLGEADDTGKPVDADLFTAAALGLLIDNGTALPNAAGPNQTLGWDTRLIDALPGWGLVDTYAAEHADLVDLLSMRSGVPRHDYSHTMSATERLGLLPPSTSFRQTWQYNNAHYMVLAELVSSLSGVPFADYVAAHILRPLGMGATYNATAARAGGRRTDGFVHVGKDAAACAAAWDGGAWDAKACLGQRRDMGWWTGTDGLAEAGAGGVIASANDMTKWLRELLAPSVLPRAFPAKAAAAVTIASPRAPHAELSAVTYGLAQFGSSYRGRALVWHTGQLAGQASAVLRLPDDGVALAVLTNDDGADAHDDVAYRVLDALLGLKPVDWTARLREQAAGRARAAGATPPPAGARPPSVDLGKVEGTYVHPAYPAISLVPRPPHTPHPPHLHLSPHAPPAHPARPAPVPAFTAPLPAVFASTLELTHHDGDTWNWTLASAFAHSAGVAVPGATGDALLCADGLGMFGDFWGQGGALPVRRAAEGRDRAEVWFDKI